MRTPHRLNQPTNQQPTHPTWKNWSMVGPQHPTMVVWQLRGSTGHQMIKNTTWRKNQGIAKAEMIKSQGIAKNNLSTYEFWNISRLRPPSPMIVMTSQRLIKAWTRSSPPKAKTSAFLILGGNFLKAAAFSRSLVIALGGYSWLRYIHNRNPGSICQVCESPTSAHDWTFNTWNGMGVDQ